jgi:hypothetical protein
MLTLDCTARLNWPARSQSASRDRLSRIPRMELSPEIATRSDPRPSSCARICSIFSPRHAPIQITKDPVTKVWWPRLPPRQRKISLFQEIPVAHPESPLQKDRATARYARPANSSSCAITPISLDLAGKIAVSGITGGTGRPAADGARLPPRICSLESKPD